MARQGFVSDKQRKRVMAELTAGNMDFSRPQAKLSESQKERIERARVSLSKGNDDPVASRELQLFVENDSQLFRQMIEPIRNNLKKKIERGTYDRDAALLAFNNLAKQGAIKYQKEVAPTNAFTTNVRINTANALLKDFENENLPHNSFKS